MTLEQARLELLQKYMEDTWEENFAIEIIIVAKELHVSIDEILDWTIMRYRTVTKLLAQYYKEQEQSYNIKQQTLS